MMVWGCPQTNQPLLVWGCPSMFTGLGSSDQLFTGSEVVLRSTSCLLVWGCPPTSTGLGSSSYQPVFTGLEIILIPTSVYWFWLWGHPQINNVYWSEQLMLIFHFCEFFLYIFFLVSWEVSSVSLFFSHTVSWTVNQILMDLKNCV